MRPRFVVVLSFAAMLAAVAALSELPVALGAQVYRRALFGAAVDGTAARVVTVIEPLVYVAAAAGLWRRRPWARMLAMAYFALVIASFLFFGVSASDGKRATAVLLWQISVVPFATFCFMFLYNGARYFTDASRRVAP